MSLALVVFVLEFFFKVRGQYCPPPRPFRVKGPNMLSWLKNEKLSKMQKRKSATIQYL